MKSGFISFGMLLISVGFVACSSEPAGPNDSVNYLEPYPWLTVLSSTPTYGYFYITAQANGTGGVNYHSGGTIYSSTSQQESVSGGVMTAGDMVISPDADNQYFSIGQPNFGETTAWGLSGNPGANIPGFIDSLYVPLEIQISSPILNSEGVSKNQDLSVQWNADPNNDSIVVWYEYDWATSQFVDSTMPQSEQGRYWIVPDNGHHVIPSAELSSVPTGGYIRLVVARGNHKHIGTSSHQFYVYGAAIAGGVFKILP